MFRFAPSGTVPPLMHGQPCYSSQVPSLLFFQMVKKNVIENIVPTVVSAKHMVSTPYKDTGSSHVFKKKKPFPFQFEKEHSPLVKDLLTYLKELLNDYKSEVDGMKCGWLLGGMAFVTCVEGMGVAWLGPV